MTAEKHEQLSLAGMLPYLFGEKGGDCLPRLPKITRLATEEVAPYCEIAGGKAWFDPLTGKVFFRLREKMINRFLQEGRIEFGGGRGAIVLVSGQPEAIEVLQLTLGAETIEDMRLKTKVELLEAIEAINKNLDPIDLSKPLFLPEKLKEQLQNRQKAIEGLVISFRQRGEEVPSNSQRIALALIAEEEIARLVAGEARDLLVGLSDNWQSWQMATGRESLKKVLYAIANILRLALRINPWSVPIGEAWTRLIPPPSNDRIFNLLGSKEFRETSCCALIEGFLSSGGFYFYTANKIKRLIDEAKGYLDLFNEGP